MGSIEVYDHKNHKWVPYVPDYEKWLQHFRDMSEGRVRPDHKGRYIVGSGNVQQKKTKVELVTPNPKDVRRVMNQRTVMK